MVVNISIQLSWIENHTYAIPDNLNKSAHNNIGMKLIPLQVLLGQSPLEMSRHYIKLLDEDLVITHKEHGPLIFYLCDTKPIKLYLKLARSILKMQTGKKVRLIFRDSSKKEAFFSNGEIFTSKFLSSNVLDFTIFIYFIIVFK